MKTRVNQKNGDALAVLGFGCMRFPMKGSNIDEARSIQMIRDSIEQGVNYFDTAYFYHGGKSENLLGNALQDGYRERVLIATKLPPFMVKSLEGAKKIFETQLTKLQTSYIDYYLLHMLTDKATFDRMVAMGVVSWLEDLKKEGIIHNFGFSFHGSKQDFEDIIRAYPWDFCQIQYNYLDENNQATRSGLELAYQMDIPVIIMEPLRGGRLVNNMPAEVIKEFKTFDPNRSPAEWALRWIWNHKEVHVVLSGMSDEVQVTENIRIASEVEAGMMSEEELAVFDRVKKIMLEKTKVPCTACGYCMPCPFGVNIPGCFQAYNNKFLLGGRGAWWKYLQTLGALSKAPAYASICTECGKCEHHCPQHIEIRKELKAVKKEMEGYIIPVFVKIARRIMILNK